MASTLIVFALVVAMLAYRVSRRRRTRRRQYRRKLADWAFWEGSEGADSVLLTYGEALEGKVGMDVQQYRSRLVEIIRANPNMTTSEVAKEAHGLKVASKVYPMTYRNLQALRRSGVLGCASESEQGARWWVMPDKSDVEAMRAFLDADG